MTAKRASKLRVGDRILGFPMSPLYVRARPTPATRNHKQVGWRIRLVDLAPLVVNGDPWMEVADVGTETPGDTLDPADAT